MLESYPIGQYPFPWGGVTSPNWQLQTPPIQQNQQGIQGVRFVSGIEEAKNCTIPLGSKALLMDKEKDRFYLKETDMTGVYEIAANFTYIATAAGTQETQMWRNGNAVPGAHALDTVATVGDNVSHAFSAIVTVPKNAPTATLNFKSANATSVRVANVIVIKTA